MNFNNNYQCDCRTRKYHPEPDRNQAAVGAICTKTESKQFYYSQGIKHGL